MKQQHRQRLRRHNLLFSCCLAAGLFIVSPLYAEPAPAAKELLDLPAFNPKDTAETKAPVKLELLPEAATANPTPAPPPVEQPASATPASEPVLASESYGPPAPSAELAAQSSTESYGPPAPPPSATVSALASEAYGPPAPDTLPEGEQTVATQLAPMDPAQDIIKDGWNEGSLMFSAAELQKLREALLAPPPEEGANSEGAPTQPGAPPPPVIDYAAFYVNSIMYHGEDQWSVWLNGRKFFPGKDSPLERVSIESVTDNQITFRWTPARKFTPPAEIDENHFQLEADGSVLISLAANQTILTKTLTVLEGRSLTPEIRALMAANTAKAQQAQAATATTPAPSRISAPATVHATPTPPPPSADDKTRGNMDTMISKYRAADERKAAKTTGATP